LPTYAYRCHDCGYAFDVVQSFTDDSLTVCPECSGVLRKQFGNIGVTFKGSGFYRTDSRASARSGKSGSGKSSTSGKSTTSTSTSTSTTAKAAPTASKAASS